jgi:hypothetical protein
MPDTARPHARVRGPVRRQSIMITGRLGTTIGSYERITGDRELSNDGGSTFIVDSRKSYEYSFASMMEALARKFERSPFGLVASEPNWIYALCNTYGVAGTHPLPVRLE